MRKIISASALVLALSGCAGQQSPNTDACHLYEGAVNAATDARHGVADGSAPKSAAEQASSALPGRIQDAGSKAQGAVADAMRSSLTSVTAGPGIGDTAQTVADRCNAAGVSINLH